MRFFIPFFFAPSVLACFGSGCQQHPYTEIETPETGPLCCDNGVADPTGTCKGQNLNAYCCSDSKNDGTGQFDSGCDGLARFTVGRQVVAFAADAPRCNTTDVLGDTIVGFVGCAA
ncbi:hypothetical protein LX32DRAFT_193759 [Colletotrichum zoysiae]|uniref:Uncharacterized protein n=1 Tax=Colletotrichum zoysiae TaxID=1216348 RepID=A0AAD9H653_9PEZI|nr:hypothetical protein LX32DRAFT_193759 [Colletotrichum zoysiae]